MLATTTFRCCNMGVTMVLGYHVLLGMLGTCCFSLLALLLQRLWTRKLILAGLMPSQPCMVACPDKRQCLSTEMCIMIYDRYMLSTLQALIPPPLHHHNLALPHPNLLVRSSTPCSCLVHFYGLYSCTCLTFHALHTRQPIQVHVFILTCHTLRTSIHTLFNPQSP
jgi:hypothetical protein